MDDKKYKCHVIPKPLDINKIRDENEYVTFYRLHSSKTIATQFIDALEREYGFIGNNGEKKRLPKRKIAKSKKTYRLPNSIINYINTMSSMRVISQWAFITEVLTEKMVNDSKIKID